MLAVVITTKYCSANGGGDVLGGVRGESLNRFLNRTLA